MPELPPAASGNCSGCAFDRLAGEYDAKIGWDELVMGVGLLRWWMMKGVKGQVCAVKPFAVLALCRASSAARYNQSHTPAMDSGAGEVALVLARSSGSAGASSPSAKGHRWVRICPEVSCRALRNQGIQPFQ